MVIDHGELVMEFVSMGEAGLPPLVVAVVFKVPLRDAQGSPAFIRQNSSQKGDGSCVEPP